jgi:hypothetical protein
MCSLFSQGSSGLPKEVSDLQYFSENNENNENSER